MKRTLLLLFVLGAFLASGTTATDLMAQQGGAAPAQPAANPQPQPQIPAVVVDTMYLMQIHPKLYAEKNALLQSQKQARDALQLKAQEYQNMMRELQGLTPGTPEYSKKSNEVRQFEFDLNLQANDLSEKAQLNLIIINYNAYQEIKKYVDTFAKQSNIVLVFNHIDIARQLPVEQKPSPETMDTELSVTQAVIWRNPSYDITGHIEKMIDQAYANNPNYPKVNFEQVKQQMLGQRSAAGGAQPPTGVATPGQPIRQ